MLVAELLFFLFVLCILHSYLFFPLLLELFGIGKKPNSTIYQPNESLPKISILMAVYNEEKVIKEKLESVFNSSYPADRIEFLIGSDCSTDQTDYIIKEFSQNHPQIALIPFTGRTGKPGIINSLSDKANGEILIITDANVIFDSNTILKLIGHFKNPKIGLVDSNMINRNLRSDGISKQEKTYISKEVRIKQLESNIWGCMMGPFGGCYAIRKELFTKVPSNFLVDDFYINMKVLEKKFRTINEVNAKVYEDVSNNLREEFRRKIRIATGNFQNLLTFKGLLNPFSAVGFCFFSHKVLRWKGPLFILGAYICNLLIIRSNQYFLYLFLLQNIVLLLPFIDQMMGKIGLHIVPLRFISHFYSMNLALLIGLIKFLKGVKSNVWEPTERNL